MPLYKYVSFNSLSHILKGEIRFSQPKVFNDPFELLPEIEFDILPDKTEINVSFSLTSPRRIAEEEINENTVPSENCNDLLSRNILEQLNDQIGILCLSKNDSSLTMWAHYADQYKGAVVEFDENSDFFEGLIEVDYQEYRPRKNISYYLKEELPIPISELCTKSIQWKYEDEYRVIRNLADCIEKKGIIADGHVLYVQKIPIELIKSVKIGERMPIEHQRFIWDKLKTTNASISLATVSINGFTFRDDWLKYSGPLVGSPILSARTAKIFENDPGPNGQAARWMLKNSPHKDIKAQ